MQNILVILGGYIGKITLPGIGVIDIIEIGLISFFVYQFMAWIKFTRAYTPERYSGSPCIYPCSLYI